MEKVLVLFIMLSSVLIEVRCLQCYVCDNCPKVNGEELQTCGMQTTPGPSTIATTTTQPTTPSTTESTTTPSTITSTTTEPMTIVTKITIEPIATSTTIATDFKNISTTTTVANNIATLTTAKINTTTAAPLLTIISTNIVTESTTSSLASKTEPVSTLITTTEPVTTSTTTTGPTKITTKPGIIPTIFTTEPTSTIPVEPMTISTMTTTESSTSKTMSTNFPTITSEPTNIQTETVTEPVIGSLTSTEPRPTFTTIPFISTLPTTPAEPMINFTTEPIMDTVPLSVTHYQELNNTKPVEDTNATYNFPQRRPRSVHEDCACIKEKICDCLISKQRSKRYALRGLGLSKEGANAKYVCIVDKFKVHETEVVKRGCAIMEEDEPTSCVNSGFGEDCKICALDQCNGASIVSLSSCSCLFFAVFITFHLSIL